MRGLSKHIDPIPALKAQVAAALVEVLQGVPQETAAAHMKLTQPRVSELRAGKLDDFSLQRLVRCLYRLGNQIEIRVLSETEVSMLNFREESAQRSAIIRADRERIAALKEKRRTRRRRRD